MALKIFEEHENWIKSHLESTNNPKPKNYFYKIFEKNDNYPIMKNNIIRTRFESNKNFPLTGMDIYKSNEISASNISIFYKSVFKNDSNFFNDFDTYLKFQLDLPTNQKSKIKSNETSKYEDLASKFSKFLLGNSVSYYKIYSRCSSVKYEPI